MANELKEYLVKAFSPTEMIPPRSFRSSDEQEVNAWIDKLPKNYEYTIWQRVWKHKL